MHPKGSENDADRLRPTDVLRRYAPVGISAFVLLIALTGTGIGVGTQTTLASHDTSYGSTDRVFSVQQGDRCFEVVPLGDGRTSVESFYDYRNSFTNPGTTSYTSYSAYGARAIQANQRSVVFLYEDSQGVSLGFLHDAHGTDSPVDAPNGGAVSFSIRGLPEGEWTVRDDYYGNGSQNDRWRSFGSPGGGEEVHWIWRDGRTDGGVYRGIEQLDRGDLVRIAPAFNTAATLWDQRLDPESDVLRSWQFVSGDGQHVRLSMSEPLDIVPGACTDVSVERQGPNDFHLVGNGTEPVGWTSEYLPQTAAGERGGAHLSKIGVSFNEPVQRFRFGLSTHASRPPHLPPVSGVTSTPLYVTMTGTDTVVNESRNVTVQFDVATDRPGRETLNLDRIDVYQYRDGAWVEVPQTSGFEVADAYVVEATIGAARPLAVAIREPDINLAVEPTNLTAVTGQPMHVDARLVNRGTADDTVPLTFAADGQVIDRRNVTVPAGGTEVVTFSHVFNQTGTQEIDVNGQVVPVEVEPPRARLAVTTLELDSSTVEAGEPFEVAATVRNVGNATGTVSVDLEAFGTTVATKDVSLSPNETEVVTFVRTIEAPGTYTLRVGDATTEVTVSSSESTRTSNTTSPSGSSADASDIPFADVVLGAGLFLTGLAVVLLLRW